MSVDWAVELVACGHAVGLNSAVYDSGLLVWTRIWSRH